MNDLHSNMTAARYRLLSTSDTDDLTPEETAQGWHFCPDWDYMLIHNLDPEIEGCCCEWKGAI